MYTELSHKSLCAIAEKLTAQDEIPLKAKLDNFLVKKHDEYYAYEKNISKSHSVEITVSELECIIAASEKSKTPKSLEDLRQIYKTIAKKSTKSVFLYGGNRI